MGGFFGVASKNDCSLDLFFGVDYHSHLGTRRGGIAILDKNGKFLRSIHNIQNSPFRTKFEKDIDEMHGNLGIGCISDFEPQPLLVHSHLGSYAITTVGIVTNKKELEEEILATGYTHFLEMSGGEINQTELIVALINQKSSIPEGIKYVQEKIKGSMSMLIMTEKGIYFSKVYDGVIEPVIFQDEFGPVNFYLLPFVKPSTVQHFFADEKIESYDDAIRCAIKHMNVNT